MPSGQLTDLTLTVSRIQAERGRQEGLEKAVGESCSRSLAGIAGIERLAPLDTGSPVPERRWVLGTSRKSLAEPLSIAVECVDGVPSRVGSAMASSAAGLRPVAVVADCWELETGWWGPDPVSRRYWALALADGGLVTVYRDRLSGSWFRQQG